MYIDILMFLNFMVDFLLIIATNRLCGYPVLFKRALGAAVLGGVYGGICVLPGYLILGYLPGRLLFLGLMSGIAFGFHRSAVRRSVLFVFLSMALGGAALTIGKIGFWSILLCAAVVVVMCLVGFRGKVGAQYVPVSIGSGAHMVHFTALRDTGNTLTDPISGQAVLVVSLGIGKRLLGLSASDLSDPVVAVGKVSGARLIPYHSVGTKGGMLLAKRFEQVKIGTLHGSCLVAFAPHEIGRGQPYDALTGGAL